VRACPACHSAWRVLAATVHLSMNVIQVATLSK
jgi:hypothetical protein